MQSAAKIRQNQGTLNIGLIARQSREREEAAQVHTLRLGQTKAIEARLGLELRAISGTLWLTQEGEPGDILLQAGQQWKASRAGRVVIQAIGNDASWTVRVAAPTATMTKWFRVSNPSL